MSEPQHTSVSGPPKRPWIHVASTVVRLSAVYLAILTVLFVAFRWSLFLARAPVLSRPRTARLSRPRAATPHGKA